MSLSTSLEGIVSRIVKEKPVSVAELQGAGRALLSKEAKRKSKKGLSTSIQNVIKRQAYNTELRRVGLEVKGKPPFRYIKKRPDLKAKLNAVILKALVEKEEELEGDIKEKKEVFDPKLTDTPVTYKCGGRTFTAENVEKKCSYYGMEGCGDDEVNKAYKELLALRRNNPDKERKRLESIGKVDKAFKRLINAGYGSHLAYSDFALSLGHAFEINEKFKDKYYTLIHGESAEFTLMHIVAKKLEQVVGKDSWEGNYVFRHDHFRRNVRSGGRRAFFGYRYQDQFWSQPLGDVCTASAYFWVGAGTGAATGFLNTILKDVFSPKLASSVSKKLQQLDKAISAYVTNCGSFCVLCVPKDKMLGCLSQPLVGGLASLDRAQKESRGYYGNEEVTVLGIDKMTPKNGILSFHEAPCLTMDQTKKINDCVHKIINAAIKGEDFNKIAIPTL